VETVSEHRSSVYTGPEPGSTASEAEISVLLVDDDGTWASSTAQLLEHQREAFSVTTATSLPAARALLTDSDSEYDCVVCDYQLETATGIDLLAEVRERDPEQPFVLVTGQGSESVASDAISRQVTDYIPKRSLGGRNDLLARRIETAVQTHRTRESLHRARRSRQAMLDILTATSSREGLTGEFCEHLVEARGYACAWVGTLDGSSGVVRQSTAGVEEYLDRAVDPGVTPAEATEPALVALEREEPHVVAPVPDSGADDWAAVAREYGFESAAAVPIDSGDMTLGVLAVYRREPTIDSEERDLLAEYGDTIGYGLRSTGWRESLLSAQQVAFDIELTDETVPLVTVDRALPDDSRLSVLTMAVRDETLLYVVRATGTSGSEVRSLSPLAPVAGVEVVSTGNSIRCELAVTPPTPETLLADRGARAVDVTVRDGRCSLTAIRQDSKAIRSLVTAVRDAYPDSTVRSVRSASADRSHPSADAIADELTDRQRQALEMALCSGYFERPREHNATEVAEKLGVSRQTFTQHLRASQRKLLSELVADDP
jgi:DNA-binding NarL/FixJ family response regulator